MGAGAIKNFTIEQTFLREQCFKRCTGKSTIFLEYLLVLRMRKQSCMMLFMQDQAYNDQAQRDNKRLLGINLSLGYGICTQRVTHASLLLLSLLLERNRRRPEKHRCFEVAPLEDLKEILKSLFAQALSLFPHKKPA